MATRRETLRALIEHEVDRPLPALLGEACGRLVREVRARHGEAVAAVLVYGSCLRKGSIDDLLVDLYVLVDGLHEAYRSRLPVLLGALIQPNVHAIALDDGEAPVRAKVAVMTLKRFALRCTARAFLPYIWGRFSQPVALIYVRDDAVRAAVVAALTDAVETTVQQALPLMPPGFTDRDLWTRAFTENYATELRAERPGRVVELYEANAERYRLVTELLAGGVSAIPADAARRARAVWSLRRVCGKAMSVLRLLKSALTFEGGVAYVLWKIERHTGTRIEATPWQRRHPILCGWLLLWRLYRRGAVR